jgi:hypothetical protein
LTEVLALNIRGILFDSWLLFRPSIIINLQESLVVHSQRIHIWINFNNPSIASHPQPIDNNYSSVSDKIFVIIKSLIPNINQEGLQNLADQLKSLFDEQVKEIQHQLNVNQKKVGALERVLKEFISSQTRFTENLKQKDQLISSLKSEYSLLKSEYSLQKEQIQSLIKLN